MRKSCFFSFAPGLLLCLGASVTACGDDDGAGSGGSGGAGGAGSSTGTGDTTSSSADATSSGTSTGAGTGGGGVDLEPPRAGIDDCDATFIDDDGVCRPSLAKCEPGSIPDVDAGCVPVGIVDCDPAFVDERGVCLPDADACDEGFFPVPTLGCVSIDGDDGCGSGTWGNVVETDGDVYVDGSYEGDDSDGTRERPFASIAEAAPNTADGGRLVLAAGTYTGGSIGRPLTIEGVCASRVTVSAAGANGAVYLINPGEGETVRLAGLTIDDDTLGVGVQSGDVTLERLRVRNVSQSAIAALGAAATLTVDRCLVTETSAGGSDGIGVGLQAFDGATVTVTRSAFLHNVSVAVDARDGSTVTLDDVAISGTEPDDIGVGGVAQAVDGTLHLRSVAGVDNLGGVGVSGSDAVAVIEDSVLGFTSDNDYGDQVFVASGGAVELRRTALVDSGAFGIWGYQGDVEAEHILVADVAGGNYGTLGVSAVSASIAKSTFARVGVGVQLGVGELTGVVVEDVPHDAAFGVGAGILFGDGGLITVSRSSVARFADIGMMSTRSSGMPGSISITRSLVTEADGSGGAWGVGIGASAINMPLTVDDTRIEQVRGAGILAATDTTVRRTLVTDVSPAEISAVTYPLDGARIGPTADGISIYALGDAELEDVWIEDAERAGLLFAGGSHALTRVRALGGEVGLALRDGATATTTDVDFSGNALASEDPSPLVVPTP